jgi:hypothetical protein
MHRAIPLLLFAACGSGGTDPFGTPDGAAPTVDGGAPGTMTLVEGAWTLPPYTEDYLCVRRTIAAELWITRIEPIAPIGTHHTVVSLEDGNNPDGTSRCGPATGTRMIYGSGVGTNALQFPAGVAVRIAPGQQVLLNLHLFNTDGAPLSGTSGVKVTTIAATAGLIEAEAILGGTMDLEIMPGVSSQFGRCTMPAGTHLFAAGPHMHKLGIRQKLSVARTGQVIYDRDYSFDSQTLDPVDITFATSERLDIECVYANDTGGTVGWGQSTNAEMCYAILFRYPAARSFPICLN